MPLRLTGIPERPCRSALWRAVLTWLLLLGTNAWLPAQEIRPAALDGAPFPVAQLQAALDRAGFGVGQIDNKLGAKTRQALADFAHATGLAETDAKAELLAAPDPVFILHTVTPEEVATIGSAPDDWEAAANVPAMAYKSLLELLAEKNHASQTFLQQLNPAITTWSAALVGQDVTLPNSRPATHVLPTVAQIQIDTHLYRLRAYDKTGQLVFSVPCSIARDRRKVPTGELRVTDVAMNPVYTFNPQNFAPDSPARKIGRKLIIPAGPNNPVGVCWLSLSLPGFGLHGTRRPETVGSMESGGCFRLANWDILTLAKSLGPAVTILLDAPAEPKLGAFH